MSSTSDPLDPLLRKLQTHAPLTEHDRAAVVALPYRLKSLESRSYVAREGDVPGTFSFLLSGLACRHKQTRDGLRQIVALNIPGDPLDLQNLFLDVSDHNVQTLTRAEVAIVSREALRALTAARPAVAYALRVLMSVEASIFQEWVLNVGRRDAASRLAHLLCEFGVRLKAQGLSDGEDYDLPMTQEQLGDALGLTAVHVNRTIRTLEIHGFVERSRRRIRVSDWHRMREFGDFNPRYLHITAPEKEPPRPPA
jgi:CRP-like cAMP-binding protein